MGIFNEIFNSVYTGVSIQVETQSQATAILNAANRVGLEVPQPEVVGKFDCKSNGKRPDVVIIDDCDRTDYYVPERG